MKYTPKEDKIIVGCITPGKRFSLGLQEAVYMLKESGYARDYTSIKNRFLRLVGCYQKPRRRAKEPVKILVSGSVADLKQRITDLERNHADLERKLAVSESEKAGIKRENTALRNMNRCCIKQLAARNIPLAAALCKRLEKASGCR